MCCINSALYCVYCCIKLLVISRHYYHQYKKSLVRETSQVCECFTCSLTVLYTSSVIRAVAIKRTYGWGNVHEKLMTEAIGPWLCSIPRYLKCLWWLYSYKQQNRKNDRGKCLGWPVTSYGPGDGVFSWQRVIQRKREIILFSVQQA